MSPFKPTRRPDHLGNSKVDDVAFDRPTGEVCVLLDPSGVHLIRSNMSRPSHPSVVKPHNLEEPAMLRRSSIAVLMVATNIFVVAGTTLAPTAAAVPAPEVEYTYNVMARRHFDFPNNDAIGYGYGICEKVARGQTYDAVMAAVKLDVRPNDEQAANYVVSNAVGILCPAEITQLRNSAANYRLPR